MNYYDPYNDQIHTKKSANAKTNTTRHKTEQKIIEHEKQHALQQKKYKLLTLTATLEKPLLILGSILILILPNLNTDYRLGLIPILTYILLIEFIEIDAELKILK